MSKKRIKHSEWIIPSILLIPTLIIQILPSDVEGAIWEHLLQALNFELRVWWGLLGIGLVFFVRLALRNLTKREHQKKETSQSPLNNVQNHSQIEQQNNAGIINISNNAKSSVEKLPALNACFCDAENNSKDELLISFTQQEELKPPHLYSVNEYLMHYLMYMSEFRELLEKANIHIPNGFDEFASLTHKKAEEMKIANAIVDGSKDMDWIWLSDSFTRYYETLPSDDELELLRNKWNEFHSLEYNHVELSLFISNNGKALANNVDVTMTFPPELKIFHEAKYKEVKQKTIHEASKLRTYGDPFAEYVNHFKLYRGGQSKISGSANPFDKMSFSNVQINGNHLNYTVDKLLHTKGIQSEKFIAVATQRGTFSVDVKSICIEYSDAHIQTFSIIVA